MEPVTVLAVADEIHPCLYEYFVQEAWASVQLILSAGDLPPTFLDFLCTRLNAPVVYVRGNHDGHWPSDDYDGLVNAHGRVVEMSGIRIAGFEGCRRYNRGECQYSEGQMSRLARRARIRALLRAAPQVLLSHAPPAGVNDGPDLCHRGFESLRRLIDVWAPTTFVHGHTHHHFGRGRVSAIGHTAVINAYPYVVFRVTATGACELQPHAAGTPA